MRVRPATHLPASLQPNNVFSPSLRPALRSTWHLKVSSNEFLNVVGGTCPSITSPVSIAVLKGEGYDKEVDIWSIGTDPLFGHRRCRCSLFLAHENRGGDVHFAVRLPSVLWYSPLCCYSFFCGVFRRQVPYRTLCSHFRLLDDGENMAALFEQIMAGDFEVLCLKDPLHSCVASR